MTERPTDSGPPDPTGRRGPTLAPGQTHLADALRVSFRVLAVLMVLVAIGFLFTGTKAIEQQVKGIKTVFGRVVEVVDQGLAITWPFPIGQIQQIDVKEQTLSVEDFWLQESPENVGKARSQWRVQSEGLRPGWDGALFTGDHNLIHAKLDCTFVIVDPLAVMANIPELQPILRNVLVGAAVRAAATNTAQGLVREQRDEFQEAVRLDAQRRLNVLTLDRRQVAEARRELMGLFQGLAPPQRQAAERRLREYVDTLMQGRRDGRMRDELLRLAARAGQAAEPEALVRLIAAFDHKAVQINSVRVRDITWPIRALRAYDDAQSAEAERQEKIKKAQGEAAQILSDAAGASYYRLVDAAAITSGAARAGSSGDDGDLIGRYIEARRAGAEEKARDLLQEIDNVLVSNQTGGQAARRIAEARAFRTDIEQRAEARVKEFQEKIGGYRSAPHLTLQRLWADTRDKILSQPLAEKLYLQTGQQKMVVQVGRDPAIEKQIRDELLKKKSAESGSSKP